MEQKFSAASFAYRSNVFYLGSAELSMVLRQIGCFLDISRFEQFFDI